MEEEGSAEGAFIQVDEAGVITLCLHRLLLSLTGLETVEAEVVDVEKDGADTDDLGKIFFLFARRVVNDANKF